MIEVAARCVVHRRRRRVADLADLDLGGTFDLVVRPATSCAFVQGDLEAVCARLAAHLEPRGLLVCGDRPRR